MRERFAALGHQVIRDFMPDQHREFYRHLPFIVTGHLDTAGHPWASILAGAPKFLTSPDPRQLAIHALPDPATPLSAALAPGMSIGLLGIEPHTRRRNRLNGIVSVVNDGGFDVDVRQSFGNCPKYIQARTSEFVPGLRETRGAIRTDVLGGAAHDIIVAADTFFIASAHPRAGAGDDRANGVDVSHRGGKSGFVRINDPSTLTVPDFLGNFFFNTLGNLVVNPRAGLLFADFDKGHLLHVATDAEIVWAGPEVASFHGAQRLLKFRVREVLFFPNALPLRFGPAQLSPHLAATGGW